MSEWKLFPVKLEPPNLLAPSKIDFTVDFFSEEYSLWKIVFFQTEAVA